jgi:UDP-2,3-diacylglucosamine hydrolase
MKAVFISDAHLKKAADERYTRLISFFDDIGKGKARSLVGSDQLDSANVLINDLYIVGDLFDFWFCSRANINPEFIPVINKLIELQKTGIRIHLFEGNHDFFMSEYFSHVLNMEIFEEWADVKIDHLRVLATHGDTVDKTDIKYILLRKILRSRPFYNFQRLIPASVRWFLASLSSNVSKEMGKTHGDLLVEKMISLAVSKFQEDYDALIFGHCHEPVLRHYTVNDKKKTFIALGDWIKHYSFVYYENRNFYLGYYRPC